MAVQALKRAFLIVKTALKKRRDEPLYLDKQMVFLIGEAFAWVYKINRQTGMFKAGNSAKQFFFAACKCNNSFCGIFRV